MRAARSFVFALVVGGLFALVAIWARGRFWAALIALLITHAVALTVGWQQGYRDHQAETRFRARAAGRMDRVS